MSQETQEKNGRPLQRVSYNQKQAKKQEWFKKNLDWYINAASFGETAGPSGQMSRRNLRTLYEVYNNQIPLEWFTHVTDPLSAKNPNHKNFPTKVRPLNILRTNIDLLLGEYPKRAFSFYVSNLGDEGYNSYLDGLSKTVNENLQKHFMQQAMKIAQEQGIDLTAEDGQQQLEQIEQSIPTPQEVAQAYQVNYKDKLAIKGQNWLKRALVENDIRRIQHKMFKDWLITGEAYSYKGVSRSKMDYKRISPLNIDYDKSPDTEFIEDGEWVVCRYWMTISDIVDMFYEDLKAEDHDKLEGSIFSSPQAFYSHLYGVYSDRGFDASKVPVYHVCWKGRKEIIELTSIDPLTGQPVIEIVDEDMPLDGLKEQGIEIKKMWVNSVLEGWAIGGGMGGNSQNRIYVGMGELEVQRNEMNNFSSCKLPYNGRKYSDTHSNNISVLEIGIPLLIMNIITGRALELTIAKSKGKILFIDKNTIPKTDGWDEEKFFYYSEALGYALLDRNQIGVDKSYNQYKVEDLSLFDNIQQLIELQRHYKQEWDDIIGISRQRKGQTYASDTKGSNEQALFQSTVITDMIFSGFDELVQKELQGLLDFSKFVNVDGVRKLYNQSEFEYEILEIDPVEYASAELGLFVTNSASETDKLKKMEIYAATLAQNPEMKPTTILELISADNVAKLKATLRDIEKIEAEVANSTAENEAAREQELEEIRMRYMKYEKQLEKENMNAEYDRKIEQEHVKGEYSLFFNKSGDGDNNNNGIPDSNEVAKNQIAVQKMTTDTILEQQKITLADKHKQQDLIDKDKDRANKLEIEKLKAKTAIRNKVSGQK